MASSRMSEGPKQIKREAGVRLASLGVRTLIHVQFARSAIGWNKPTLTTAPCFEALIGMVTSRLEPSMKILSERLLRGLCYELDSVWRTLGGTVSGLVTSPRPR